MTRFFLKMKHWQFFILTIGLPIIWEFVFIDLIATSGKMNPMITPLFFVTTVLFMVMLIGWMYSIGVRFNRLLPEGVTMKTGFYKFTVIFPVVYVTLFILGISVLFGGSASGNEPNPAMFALIVPLHFFAMFCMFYMLYFTSKTLKTVEVQKKIEFGDYAGEFFLMWFFPIGIWFLQPRINKIFEEKLEN